MYENLISIDKMSHKPIYEQIIEQFENLIVTDILKSGEMIPSVRSLSKEIGTNPNTIQKAYNELERSNITYSVPGVGRYISDNAKDIIQKSMMKSDSELKNAVEKLKLSGMTVGEIIAKVKLYYGGENND
ncbi:MAG: GntR family transcriptional regulator [Acutalibacteraceae bacterium]